MKRTKQQQIEELERQEIMKTKIILDLEEDLKETKDELTKLRLSYSTVNECFRKNDELLKVVTRVMAGNTDLETRAKVVEDLLQDRIEVERACHGREGRWRN